MPETFTSQSSAICWDDPGISRAEPPSNEFAAKNPSRSVDGLDVGMNGAADGIGDEVGTPTIVCVEFDCVSTTGTATAVVMMIAVMNDPNMILIL